MLSVPTNEGQILYGPLYKDANYFIVKHAVSAYTPVNSLNPGVGPRQANCFSPDMDDPATRPLATAGTCDMVSAAPASLSTSKL